MEEKTNGKTFPRTLSVEGQIKNQLKYCEKKHSSNFKDEMLTVVHSKNKKKLFRVYLCHIADLFRFPRWGGKGKKIFFFSAEILGFACIITIELNTLIATKYSHSLSLKP